MLSTSRRLVNPKKKDDVQTDDDNTVKAKSELEVCEMEEEDLYES